MSRGAGTDPAAAAGRVDIVRTAVLLVLASLPALLDPGALARGAAMLHLAESAHPYLPTSHVMLRVVWLPLVALSGMIMVLAPGLVLAMVAGAARSAAEWLLMGLAISVVELSVVIQGLEAAAGGPVRGTAFAAVAVGTTVGSTLLALVLARGRRVFEFDRAAAHTIAAACSGAFVLFLALEPKFLWETFNGDGAHAYESTRLLLHQAVPFWTPAAGHMSNYPGITSFLESYPMAWFIRLFGELEVSVRLPYLLFLGAGVYAGLLALVEFGRAAAVDNRARWLLWLGLAGFTIVMAFSATYNPYHADIALPATQDALVVAWFLGSIWAFVGERRGWFVAFAALTYVTSPAGLILLGLWVGAATVLLRPVPFRMLLLAAASIIGCLALARFSPVFLTALGFPVPGTEHDTGTLAARLLRLQWRDWHRFVYVIVPAGILPSFAALLVWRLDRLGRAVAAVALAQFVFFYFQSRVSLHYFVPAMLLPLAVFWRAIPALVPGRLLTPAVTAAAALAIVASLPADPGPQLAARPVGAQIDDRLGGYDEAASGAFKRANLLSRLLPRDAHHSVPDSSYGGSPLSWFYYAHRAAGPRSLAYVLQDASSPPPPGSRLIDSADGATLYVLDEEALARDRARRPPNSIARIYRISKETLFRGS